MDLRYCTFLLHNYPTGNIFTWLTKSLPIKLLIKCNCNFFFNFRIFFDDISISDFINEGMKVNKKNLEAITLKIGDGYNCHFFFQFKTFFKCISISPSQASKINLADWLARHSMSYLAKVTWLVGDSNIEAFTVLPTLLCKFSDLKALFRPC